MVVHLDSGLLTMLKNYQAIRRHGRTLNVHYYVKDANLVKKKTKHAA